VKKLLLVDADPLALCVLDVGLRKAGYLVTTASDVAQAVEAVEATAPDAVVTETRLPPLDGFVLVRSMRARPEQADIPVVFVASQPSDDERKTALELGVEDYLAKPVYLAELTARIQLLLARATRRSMEKQVMQSTQGGPPSSSANRGRLAGSTHDLALVDLLQTFEASRKSGVALVRNAMNEARIYFRDGRVVDAELGPLRGEEAIYRALIWDEATFEVELKPVANEDTIGSSTQAIVIKGMRRVDEWVRLCSQVQPLAALLDVHPPLLLERLSTLTEIPEAWKAMVRLPAPSAAVRALEESVHPAAEPLPADAPLQAHEDAHEEDDEEEDLDDERHDQEEEEALDEQEAEEESEDQAAEDEEGEDDESDEEEEDEAVPTPVIAAAPAQAPAPPAEQPAAPIAQVVTEVVAAPSPATASPAPVATATATATTTSTATSTESPSPISAPAPSTPVAVADVSTPRVEVAPEPAAAAKPEPKPAPPPAKAPSVRPSSAPWTREVSSEADASLAAEAFAAGVPRGIGTNAKRAGVVVAIAAIAVSVIALRSVRARQLREADEARSRNAAVVAAMPTGRSVASPPPAAAVPPSSAPAEPGPAPSANAQNALADKNPPQATATPVAPAGQLPEVAAGTPAMPVAAAAPPGMARESAIEVRYDLHSQSPFVRDAQRALLKGDTSRAMEFAQKAVTKDPSDADGWLTLAASRKASGDLAGAADAYRGCIAQAHTVGVMNCRVLAKGSGSGQAPVVME
jgi:DNA-binding response OmpR family regulator